MAPVEPWERVWIDAETFVEDVHSYINCTECHGGEAVDDFETAHEGVSLRVTTDPLEMCGRCHLDVTPAAVNSLHYTLEGYDTALHDRSVPENHETLEVMQANHCNDCHASCGDCHISQPQSVGGGLIAGHVFNQTPSMSRNCTACHGSRVKNEYYGLNEGVDSDVHFRARIACTDCHTGDEMHGMGMGEEIDHRYDGAQSPTCESCHEDVVMGEESEIRQHEEHAADLMSCQVCHSTTYTNCVNCHVEQTEDGIPFYSVEAHELGFFIGLNPDRTEDRPYKYVPVRHVPVEPDSFSFYGENLLPNYDNRPTWVYATPHNIQRETPQNEKCDSCHENDDFFLTSKKVEKEEREANKDVIVREPPE